MSEALLRDEQYQRLLILKDRVKQLNVVIREGELAEDFRDKHAFFPVFAGAMASLRESYNAEAHKAARDSRAEISNFLGREECVKTVMGIFEEFSTRADSAETEKESVEQEIKELTEILASPEGETQDVGGAMG